MEELRRVSTCLVMQLEQLSLSMVRQGNFLELQGVVPRWCWSVVGELGSCLFVALP